MTLRKITKLKKELLRRDLQELEKTILPKHKEAASELSVQKAAQRQNSQKITKQGNVLHREIDRIIENIKSEIDDKNSQNIARLDKKEDEINRNISQISQVINELKLVLEAEEFWWISKYKSRNDEFRKLPQYAQVPITIFQPNEIKRERLIEQIGYLTPLSSTTEKRNLSLPLPVTDFVRPICPALDVPQIIAELDTACAKLFGVSCRNDEEIWTHGDNKMMILYNLKGELVKAIETKSGNGPADIAVTRGKELVYTDFKDRSINLVSSTGTYPFIRLRGWRPRGICSTSSDGLLVIMVSDDKKQTKVVRYSGSAERQTIQRDEQGRPLYSSSLYLKYLIENTNLDICVADNGANAVVVVNATGKFRFRYTGLPSTPRKNFYPYDIHKDSHGRILTAEKTKNCIHVIDQDGQFIRYIDQCDLRGPFSLCLDSSDNILAAEYTTGKVKKIKFYK